MKMSKTLKGWLETNCKVPTGSADELYRKAAGSAIGEGTLTVEKLTELGDTPDEGDKPSILTKFMDSINKRFDAIEAKGCGDDKKKKKGMDKGGKSAAADEEEDTDVESDADADSDVEAESSGAKMFEAILNKNSENIIGAMQTIYHKESGVKRSTVSVPEDGPTPIKLFTMEGVGLQEPKAARIEVRNAASMYDTSTKQARYGEDFKHVHLRGKQVTTGENGRFLDEPSMLAKAISGAWFKFSVNSACKMKGQGVPRCYRMTEHDNALVQYALHEMPFTGVVGYNEQTGEAKYKMNGSRKNMDVEIKAILDDSVSGGLEAAPIVFDDALILTPLLYGEIYPLINVVNLTRGRRVEGFSMGNPTITSGTAEGTSIALFDTASFIAAFDTTIFNAVGAMELGKDFEDDSPTNIGEQVITQYGEAMLTWLDEQPLLGDGTTEPEGVFVASGTVAVSSDKGGAGPHTLSDYEGLLFGVKKKYRPPQDRARCVYVSNETSYRRSRAMKVDPASSSTDERRMLGLDHENYMTLGHPHKINENITNAKAAFFNARRYRMYRRLGFGVVIEEGGKELTLKNSRLIVVRGRFGGHLEDGNACAVMTDLQS